jgi:hypothetical protein
VTRAAASSLASNDEVEPVVIPPPDATVPGYFPNWDLLEPVGVRQIPRARRTPVMPEQAAVRPAPVKPPSDIRSLPAAVPALAVD